MTTEARDDLGGTPRLSPTVLIVTALISTFSGYMLNRITEGYDKMNGQILVIDTDRQHMWTTIDDLKLQVKSNDGEVRDLRLRVSITEENLGTMQQRVREHISQHDDG